MLGILLLLFIAVPITELIILIRLGQAFGFLATATLVLGTGLVGAVLARAEGLRTLRAMQREVKGGRVPGREILDGISVLVGGAMLLTPGLLTDVAGLSLLCPPTRRVIQLLGRRWLEGRIRSGALKVGVLRWDMGGAQPGGPRRPGADPRHEIRVPPPGEGEP